MILFQNGHVFHRALECHPPVGDRVPVVQVEMAGTAGEFVPVLGKVDTGAFRTVLRFSAAQALGIPDPTLSPLRKGSAHTATGEQFAYYVHSVLVKIEDGNGQRIVFPLQAAFSDRVSRNLFGADWLAHICLAVDSRAVYFLKD